MTRRGASLLELLLALVVLAILLAIALPRLGAIGDAAALRAARSDLVTALDAARGAALRLGTDVELRDDGATRTLVPALTGPDSQPIWHGPVAALHGASLSGLASPIAFGPAGIAVGAANRTLTLHRGQHSLVLVLSRLGRMR